MSMEMSWADADEGPAPPPHIHNGDCCKCAGHTGAYSPANPYELRMPVYASQKSCDYWPLHVPHYWDLASADPQYCLGQGSLEEINEH